MIFIKDRNSHEWVREHRAPSVLVGAQFTFELNEAPIALLRCNIFFGHPVPSGSPFWHGTGSVQPGGAPRLFLLCGEFPPLHGLPRRRHAACMKDITFWSGELHRRPHSIARLMSALGQKQTSEHVRSKS